MDSFAELPPTPRQSLSLTLKDLSKEASGNTLQELRRGSQRIWERFWESPVQQRVARHLVILGLATSIVFIAAKHEQTVASVSLPTTQTITTELSIPLDTAPSFSTPSVQTETQSLSLSEENFTQRIFTGLNSEQKQKFQEEISRQFKIYQNDKIRIKNTLRWEPTLDLIVKDKRLNIPLSERDYWKKRMLEIIFVESEGNPKASSGIAFGLTQLKTATAKEAAQRSGVLSFDIYNGWDNSFLGLTHQLNLAKRYGVLSLWTHHLGSGNMDLAVKTYLIKVKKMPVKDFDENKLIDYINQYKITPFMLLKEPAVTAALKNAGAFGDQTEKYFAWLVAAGQAMGLENPIQTQTRG